MQPVESVGIIETSLVLVQPREVSWEIPSPIWFSKGRIGVSTECEMRCSSRPAHTAGNNIGYQYLNSYHQNHMDPVALTAVASSNSCLRSFCLVLPQCCSIQRPGISLCESLEHVPLSDLQAGLGEVVSEMFSFYSRRCILLHARSRNSLRQQRIPIVTKWKHHVYSSF